MSHDIEYYLYHVPLLHIHTYIYILMTDLEHETGQIEVPTEGTTSHHLARLFQTRLAKPSIPYTRFSFTITYSGYVLPSYI